MTLQSVNPANGKLIADYPVFTYAEVRTAIEAAHADFLQWRNTDLATRATCLRRIGVYLLAEKERLAGLIAQEMGKPIRSARAEIEKCAWVCDYYAEQGPQMLRDEPVKTDAGKSYIHHRGLGVVLAIMPWNFPFWQAFRFAAPNFMAGNAAVLKHAANVCGCALAIEQAFKQSGAPDNLFRTLLIKSDRVAAVIEHDKIRAVTLTGSTAAGRAVATVAGRFLKKSVLELGGSDPYLILEDADIDAAAQSCAASRLINNGQSCIAAKRFIVVNAVREKFEKAFVHYMQQPKVGDPMDEATELGPLARGDLREELQRQVIASMKRGSTRCLTGGAIPSGPGAFYPPTVLTDVPPGTPVYTDEIFGPVAAVIPVADTDAAIQVANSTVFGLGAAIFTRDVAKGEALAVERLEAGSCFVNDYVRSDPRLPFGGIKDSGYGRELSHYGIKEFVNIKTVYIK
jgi:succinate-semialdehyde dehydrogenase/glutarate-semialdehyde dehydrogenase